MIIFYFYLYFSGEMQIFLIVMFLGNCFAGPSQYLVEGKDGSKYLIETGGNI